MVNATWSMLLADLDALADADDRGQPVLDGLLGLGVDQLVVLAVVLPTLGVADQDVPAAELGQHGRRDVTGVGTVVERRHVLRAVRQRPAGRPRSGSARCAGR